MTDPDAGPDPEADADPWAAIGRALLARELAAAGADTHTAAVRVADRLEAGDDVTAADVREVRRSLNRTRRLVEDHLATAVGGTDPWADPGHPMPVYAARERAEPEPPVTDTYTGNCSD
jgi:hypothetical protein